MHSLTSGVNLKPIQGAVLITLLAVFVAPRAFAAEEPSEAHAVVEAGASQGTVLGSWAPHPSYSVSLLCLGERGQGFGARLNLLPPPTDTGTWKFSADAMLRFTNGGPFYLKPIGGIAVAPPGALWPPRIRAGAEIGLTAIRGGLGVEAGLTAVYAFPPSSALEGEWVVSAGLGILFSFGAPSRAAVASRQHDRSGDPPSSSSNPVMGVVLAATPMGGGFNTCEGSKATPQCLQAMSEIEGTASTGGTSPPTTGATTRTVAPAGGATSPSAPATAPSAAVRIDLKKSIPLQARAAVDIRNSNHHIDESDEPQAPTFEPAALDRFDVGTAVNYEKRYSDVAYWRVRGREQQLIDAHGGARSDTGKPYRTENAVRGVAKDNPQGRLFHDAATARWGQLYPYTGN